MHRTAHEAADVDLISLERSRNLEIVSNNYPEALERYRDDPGIKPLLLLGDAFAVLRALPDSCIDFAMTSPPYWGKREYENGGIGLERDYSEFVRHLAEIFLELKRVLKPTGSFWLNIGDSYLNKNLVGIPWRVAFELIDNQGWILRNSIIWNKVKSGMDTTKDRLGNVHENVFHFVKKPKGYYYDADAIRSKLREAKVVNGAIVSATGISGVRYKRQIELSTTLSDEEKAAAFKALDQMLDAVTWGRVSDFRMIIRGQQRTTHSDSEKVSGRAKELRDKGFYFLRYHPNGSKPSDVWDIIPEDTQKRETHFAPYPVDLCRLPILATCPPGGVVLDPFCGTGTTLYTALNLGRKSIGIDISRQYLNITEERCVTAMSKVIELFGHSAEKQGQNWNQVVGQQQCPFLGKKCYKVRKSDPDTSIGSCTVLYGRPPEPYIICPTRLMERHQIFTDCFHLLTVHEPGNELHIVPEVSIPGGSVDYFLVSAKNGRVKDFVGIELQTLDTTGTVWPERQRLLRELGVPRNDDGENSDKPYGMNWKMTAKTILIQLHHKVQTFENVNKKLVLVIQDKFFDYMRREFNFAHLSNPAVLGDSMHLHTYRIDKQADNSFKLSMKSRLSTDADGIGISLGLQAEARVELAQIIQALQAKLSAKTLFVPGTNS